MTIFGERLAAVLCSAAALYMMNLSWDFPAEGNLFPIFSCGAIVAIGVLMIIRTYVSPDVFAGAFNMRPTMDHARPLLLTAGVVIYVLLIFELGYYTTSLLFLVALSLAVGVRDFKVIALTAIVAFPLMYAFFELFLNAQLPRGILI